jgi:hypothetical protein
LPTSTIEARLRRLEDLEAIRDLMFRYAQCMDRGVNGKVADIGQLDEVFADDVIWHHDGVETKGLHAVKNMLRGATASGVAVHSFTNPLITLDGDSAHAKWVVSVAVVRQGQPNHDSYVEDVDYMRGSSGWRIKALRLYHAMSVLP